MPLAQAREVSTTIVDRNGKLLRAYAMADGRWRLPVDATTGVDPGYLKLLLAYEDRRFRSHAGVDPLALGRAALQLATRGHIVSGGSTITMQLARLMEPRRERSVHAKLRQMVRALEIERQLSKDQILDLYLALAPYGGNLEGIRAASIAYFGKEPKRLSLAEAALLVALPQSPETRRLDRYPEAARAARDRVLDRMVEEGQVSRRRRSSGQGRAGAAAAQADADPGAAFRRRRRMATVKDAPRHPADAGCGPAEGAGGAGARSRDGAGAEYFGRHPRGRQCQRRRAGAGRIAGLFRRPPRRAGRHDPRRALAGIDAEAVHLWPRLRGRLCASGKPDRGPADPFRLLRAGKFRHDVSGHGAGAQGAAAVAERAGDRLARPRRREPAVVAAEAGRRQPGAAQGRGAGPCHGSRRRRRHAAGSGAALLRAGRGSATPGRCARSSSATDDERDPLRLMDPVAAWQVGNVLIGTPPPENAPHNRIAFKTGTSYGYRDAWSVGFDGRMTIGVWVGRPDGAPVPGLVGRTAAAPILFDAFARTGKLPVPLPKPPKGTLVASNAKLPLPLRRFRPAGELVRSGGEQAPHIQFPLNGSRIDVCRLRGRAGRGDAGQGRRRRAADDRCW